jgi:hypothetical protein
MKKIISFLLMIIMSVTCLGSIGCSPDLAKKYGVNKDALYGFFEPFWEKKYTSDEFQIKGFNLDVTIDLMAAMGCTSNRFYVPSKVFSTFFVDYDSGDVEIELDEEIVAYFHDAATKLKDKGITTLVGEAIVFPPFVAENGQSFINGSLTAPLYGTDSAYEYWMNAVSAGFKAIAEEFPEVEIWEMGNEFNTDSYMHPYSYNQVTKDGGFDYMELININTDYMYFANKGIKEGNPKAVSLTPGYTSGGDIDRTDIEDMLEGVYENINSGNFPRTAQKTTDSDDYFGGFAWHPYNFHGMPDDFVEYNDGIYQVAIDNGDIGKKVYFTEMGWYDDDSSAKMDAQVSYIEELYDLCKNEMWYVECCLYFRFYNCDYDWSGGGAGGPEKTFGVFFEPTIDQGFMPKNKAIKMQEIFGGTGDLYMWSDLDALEEKIDSSI